MQASKVIAAIVLSGVIAANGVYGAECDYEVSLDGHSVKVEDMRCSAMPVNIRWPGHQREKDQTEICGFVRFDFRKPTEVAVKAARKYREVVVRPLSKKVVARCEGETIRFTVREAGAYSVELDGAHCNLMVFADVAGDYAGVDLKNAKTRYYGAGEHDAGVITMHSGETLFLDEGATVYGRIVAKDANGIRILGRGILDASRVKEEYVAIDPKLEAEQRRKNWAVTNVKRYNTIDLHFCDDVVIKGITVRDSQLYAIRPVCCDNLTVANVKILGSWRYNSDGLDMHNCRKVRVRDTFIRTYDDSICVKGFDYLLPESEMTHNGVKHDIFEDVIVERCTIWNDWGRALEIGAETRASEIRNITFRDCDILAVQSVAMDVQNCDQAHVHDVTFEKIRVEYPAKQPLSVYSASAKDFDENKLRKFARLTVAEICYIAEYSKAGAENRGKISGVRFRDIDVMGPKLPEGAIRGFDEEHCVSDVTIERVRLNGRDVTAEYIAGIKVGKFATLR